MREIERAKLKGKGLSYHLAHDRPVIGSGFDLAMSTPGTNSVGSTLYTHGRFGQSI